MTIDTPVTPETEVTKSQSSPLRKRVLIALAAVAITAGAVFAGQAIAKGHQGFGNPLQRMERMLDRVDATSEQKNKIEDIVWQARKDLRDLRGEREALTRELTEILSAPTIDRAKLEAARASRIAKLEDVSKRITTAIADAAEVLKPEQRVELVKLMERMHEERQWRREDRGHGKHGKNNQQ